MPFRSVNGIRLRYETWGVGPTPLVLLHGLGSSADDWFLQLPAFAPHYLCVAVDLRGHGLSDKPVGNYAVGLFTSDVAELLRDLDLAPAHILGLSLGGMVAQQLALAHPQVVRSLVLINTLPGLWPPPRDIVRVGMRRLPPPWRQPDMAAAAARVSRKICFPTRPPSSSGRRPRHASRRTIRLPIAARSWRGALLAGLGAEADHLPHAHHRRGRRSCGTERISDPAAQCAAPRAVCPDSRRGSRLQYRPAGCRQHCGP